jgi:hypothetical protein
MSCPESPIGPPRRDSCLPVTLTVTFAAELPGPGTKIRVICSDATPDLAASAPAHSACPLLRSPGVPG